ncbi:MAG: hypothetical protein ACI8QS_001553 [Planctomycetota bacterium]|jgi:hypothetical protein
MARPEEVELSRHSGRVQLNWRSQDGTTRWQAELRDRDSALLSLRSEVDAAFDWKRAFDHACTQGSSKPDQRRLDQIESMLWLERQHANCFESRVDHRLGDEFEENVFFYAPPS